ncbi:MAG: hypothetical protein C3F07_16845 [Anaerolineales bacterium]|nr:ClbS/DfsB family four-helix bundle protein [Anaerolineae bacterium]PWB70501.1 MAG: hypothetical protein C3F07_16845 [Anaerolineales bacterium]
MVKSNKEIFLARLMNERDRFELLLNRVGYTRRMTLKGVAGRHSIKDIIAHIWAYEQYIADRMNEILHGQSYSPCKTQTALDAFLDEFGYPDFGSPLLDDDSPGEWVMEKHANVSLEDLVMQEIQAFASIISALEAMPEEMITRHNLYNRVTKHTCEHYREHAHEIRRWLRVNGIQIN